jgi:hypothetical protein
MLGDALLAISRQNIIKMIQDEGKSVVTVREQNCSGSKAKMFI